MNKFWCFLLLSGFLQAEIIELHTWKEIDAKLETLTTDDLAIFDVDETLILYDHPLLRPKSFALIDKFIMEKGYGIEKIAEVISNAALQFDLVKLIDAAIPHTLNNLKERSVKQIVLTAQPTGKAGLISKMEEWRHQQLQSVGIDFSKGAFRSTYHFSQLGSDSEMPVFHDGILCSCFAPKGDVLAAFLDRINFRPSRVIFIDDKRSSNESVSKVLEERNIPHLCIVFKLSEMLNYDCEEEKVIKHLESLFEE